MPPPTCPDPAILCGKPLRISLVVPAYNEEKLLGLTLGHLRTATAAFTQRGWEVELIVCDNNSTDRTAEIARAAGAKVVFEPFNQIARARNTGAAAATGEWLLFVDADSRPSRGLLAETADKIADRAVVAGGATMWMDEGPWAGALVVRAWNLFSRLGGWMAGSFIFVEADAFREIGGFSERLFAGEELDLSDRLKGYARAHGRKVVILHRHPLTTSGRKLRLYTPWEHARMLLRMAWDWRSLGRREACPIWYDGRR